MSSSSLRLARSAGSLSDAGRTLALAACLALAVGCDEGTRGVVDGALACDLAALRPVSEPALLGTEELPARGFGQSLRLEGPGYVQVTLEDPTACVQVGHAAVADGGEEWIPEGEYGPYCATCPQRTLTLVGGGLFALPSDASELGEAVTFSLERRSCETLHRLEADLPALGVEVRVLDRAVASPDARGVLRVDLAVFGDDWLSDGARGAAAGAWVREVEAELADAGLRVDLHAVCTLPAPAAIPRVEAGDTGALAPLLDAARAQCAGFEPSAHDPRITVLHVPCLELHDPLLRVTTDIAGYATHIPGGFAPGHVPDAVVVASGCREPTVSVSGVPLGLARRAAHELGHYLGLFHSVESDGSEDMLADTDERNLMSAVPGLAGARGLSPSQVAIVRGHPSVRWPLPGHEACAVAH